ncbi:MAG: hypothetical protein IPP67_06395 [Rhodospirillaceae bacterium]|nr:hypothetical protein [Rhodospirillaceae bacterium]
MVGVFILVGIFAICIIGVKISQAIEDSVNNRAKILSDSIFKNRQNELAAIIDKKKVEVLKEIQERLKKLEIKEKYVTDIKSSFEKSFVTGRQWLAQFVGEADKVIDEQLINYLTTKNHPAYSAAEIVKEAKAEKRDALKQAKFLQYQINTYKEYFPFLDEYEELILDEKIDFSGANTEKTLEEVDRTVLFLSKEEFEKLSTKEKNQLALDRYLEKHKEKWEIGRFTRDTLGLGTKLINGM